jgi:DNA-binding transcriptional regulator LsrR (DeoR family)
MTDLHDQASQLHRPHDRDTLRAAAHELYQRGLTPTDIAPALGLTTYAVRQLLGRTTPE